MKKIGFCLLTLVLLTSIFGCAREDNYSGVVVDKYGVPHFTLKYYDDNRGRKHFPQVIKPRGEKILIFDPKVEAWAAYDAKGQRVMTGRGSGGSRYCKGTEEDCRTPSGLFRVYRKRGADCRSGEFKDPDGKGARMPYCMYFYNGNTIHAGYGLGGHGSHGCIRVLESAAKWLSESFVEKGTQIYVMSYDEDEPLKNRKLK